MCCKTVCNDNNDGKKTLPAISGQVPSSLKVTTPISPAWADIEITLYV